MMPMPVADTPVETDALIIGAGPVGLYQAFQLGLLGIGAHVVDALPHAGGQCMELYPDKPIYDIPAITVCSGRELTARLLAQIKPFGTPLHLSQLVRTVERQANGRWAIGTAGGPRFIAKVVVIAAGVGAFEPRRLQLDGIDRFEGGQLHYRLDDPGAFAGQRVVVVGGDDTALEWVAQLAATGPSSTGSVTLLHRRDVFQATPERVSALHALVASGAVSLATGQPRGIGTQGDRLCALQASAPDGTTLSLPLDALLVPSGLSPRLGPLADWGLALERKQLPVDSATFATAQPGIFAVGDINIYPGKRKLIVCGFHECVLAAYAAAALVFPDVPVQLQYTTTSPRLHQRLGVATPHKL